MVLACVVIPVACLYVGVSFDSADAEGVESETRSWLQTALLWGLAPLVTLVLTRFSDLTLEAKLGLACVSSLMTWGWRSRRSCSRVEARRRLGRAVSGSLSDGDRAAQSPQQLRTPNASSRDATPSTASPAMSSTPVSR